MKKYLLLISIFILQICMIGQDGKMELNGVYQGKDIYIYNPYFNSQGEFCISKILLNGSPILDAINTLEIKIDLSVMSLKKGDPIIIEVFYKNNCFPKVLNSDFEIKSSDNIISMTVTDDGILHWITKNETNKTPFIIEQYRWNKWIKIGEIGCSGLFEGGQYSFKIHAHDGENEFRIKQINEFCISRYLKHNFKVRQVKFKIKKNIKEIHFTGETIYEINAVNGNLIKTGFGQTINYSKFPKGVYHLNYDNSSTSFNVD